MFPRVKKSTSKSGSYGYLVISESVRDSNGRSTTRDVARLGNMACFDRASVRGLVDGLIRLFEIEEYGLSDQVEILESLEHGSIIFWRALWERLGLDRIVADAVRDAESRISIPVEKYVELMVLNRCINPLSKLATSRWMGTTCYAAMRGYADLSPQVEYFYRSMDYLLKGKESIEATIFEQLRNLFSVNVRLTFYDITSTFFYGDGCELAANGFSRDKRPDKLQIVIGVVTSYEGYPLKHFVFEGNTQDQTTVDEVVTQLRREYQIEQTVFVGDRGMISRLNLTKLQDEGYDYIMGVKARQDEMVSMVVEDEQLFGPDAIECKGLRIADRRVPVKEFLRWKLARILELGEDSRRGAAWKDIEAVIDAADDNTRLGVSHMRRPLDQLGIDDRKQRQKVGRLLSKYRGRYTETVRLICARNDERAEISRRRRSEKLEELSGELDHLFASPKKEDLVSRLEKLFEGHHRRYRRFFTWTEDADGKQPTAYTINTEAIDVQKRYDGLFVLTTSRENFSPQTVVDSYKNLQEVETLFDDLKHFVDIHPMRHRLERRVRAHVFLCILALLLKRVLELDCLGTKTLTEPLETIAKSKLVKYRVRMSARSTRTKTFCKVTATSPEQDRLFAAVGIRNPACLEEFVW